MSPHRVVIVDDQIDVRRMLRAALETLGPGLHILDMPSAEEALLEIARQPVDLLISDIRLPGISGLELAAKARRRVPDLKIILITALGDAHTRRLAAEAELHAFFTKPLHMPDLLDSVERALGLAPSILPVAPSAAPEASARAPSISEHLTSLRRALGATAVILISDQGRALAQAGDAPHISGLTPVLLTALSASAKVSLYLGVRTPNNLLWIHGKEYILCLAHVGPSHALLAILSPQEARMAETASAVISATQDLLAILANLGATAEIAEVVAETALEPLAPQAQPADELPEAESGEAAFDVDAIFQKPLKRKYATRDLNNFWESAAEQADPNNIGDASVISYEQAKKLGLAPKDHS